MVKYVIGMLAVVVLVVASVFVLVARRNDSRAEAKPATSVTITIAPSGITPREFQVERGRAIEITVSNRVEINQTLELDSPDVEQLAGFAASHSGGLPALYIDSKSHSDVSATARFTRSGTYELHLTGFSLADEIIKAVVK